MKQELAVHLQVHRGRELTFDAKGNSTNENHPVVVMYDTPEWQNYMKHLLPNGIIKAEVKKVLDLTQVNEGVSKESPNYYKEIADVSGIQAEVDKWLVPAEAQLTPEQQRIADLEARLDAITNGATNVKAEQTDEEKAAAETAKAERKAAATKYAELYGKAPAPVWTLEIINQKIAEFKQAN